MSRVISLALAASALALIGSSPALADPCEAIPRKGPMPGHLHPGARFTGRVVHVIDGDGLCVATGPGPKNWVEVRVAGFYAPQLNAAGGQEAKAALQRIANGRQVSCVAGKRSYDRVVARCEFNGRDLAERMRAAGVREGGRGRGAPQSGHVLQSFKSFDAA